uniref:Uncharacterized protein n=1 Tax=Branchiostoma floridae TaxID=7739 RepID=C3Z9K7_BRAFL|eukprot:XP_002594692.1 hypothetical protein BRAFLDRAFT_101448 [Branchiostoma floridae]
MEEQSKTEDIQERSEDVPQSSVRLNDDDTRGWKRSHSPEEQGSKVKVKRVECSEGTDPEGEEVKECQGHSHATASTGIKERRSQDTQRSCVGGASSSSKDITRSQGHVNVTKAETSIEKSSDDIGKVVKDDVGQDIKCKNVTEAHGQGTSHELGSEGHLLVTYVTKHRVWMGRRKVRRQLPREAIPALSLEEQVTNRILEEDPVGGTEMVFQVHYGRKYDVNSTAVELRFLPEKRGDREFWDLFHFLELFLIKMVDNHMMV